MYFVLGLNMRLVFVTEINEIHGDFLFNEIRTIRVYCDDTGLSGRQNIR